MTRRRNSGAWTDHHAYDLRMADSWGDDGPPDDAYGRLSRDLAAVTADYAAYLEHLPTRLAAEYVCEVRAMRSPWTPASMAAPCC